MTTHFLELHYLVSGDPVMINVAAISRVYVHHETKETRIALLEDKNGEVDATVCSRAAVYRVRETYRQVKLALGIAGSGRGVVVVGIDKLPAEETETTDDE